MQDEIAKLYKQPATLHVQFRRQQGRDGGADGRDDLGGWHVEKRWFVDQCAVLHGARDDHMSPILITKKKKKKGSSGGWCSGALTSAGNPTTKCTKQPMNHVHVHVHVHLPRRHNHCHFARETCRNSSPSCSLSCLAQSTTCCATATTSSPSPCPVEAGFTLQNLTVLTWDEYGIRTENRGSSVVRHVGTGKVMFELCTALPDATAAKSASSTPTSAARKAVIRTGRLWRLHIYDRGYSVETDATSRWIERLGREPTSIVGDTL